MLQDKRFLITGISDAGSLALHAAKAIVEQGGQVVCAGLGVTPHHTDLSDKARAYLSANEAAFRETVKAELGEDTPIIILIRNSIMRTRTEEEALAVETSFCPRRKT